MRTKMRGDTRWLELHGGTWRVTLAVPKALQAKLGTRLKQSLRTDSLTTANALKHRVIGELKARISAAATIDPRSRAELMREAGQFAALRANMTSDHQFEEFEAAVRERQYEILGPEVGVAVDGETEEPFAIYDHQRSALADQYGDVAFGGATPISLHHEDYLTKSTVSPRTKADDVRALKYLDQWCTKKSIKPHLETITRKLAARFADDLAELSGGLDPVTQNKYLNRLSRYWQYLVRREITEANVWRDLSVEVPKSKRRITERAFTNEEVKILLTGGAPQKMLDLMMIGALSGARLDAIVDLRVGDAVDGAFTFKAQKTEISSRDVPIHPALKEIVARRTAGKKAQDDLFPDWPAVKKAGSLRERSFKASNLFTEYRRSVGVEEMIPGRRRSLVNFHSFRRWFITTAERAGQNGDIIAAVVGHKRSGMTLGRYSEGPEMRQARRCVAAVKLPPIDGREVTEPRSLKSSRPGKQAGAVEVST